MEQLFNHGLSTNSALLLFLCLAIALAFEFVNGFHDTANAVATVIYTNTLRPGVAVALSGLCNFLGVFVGGIAVAVGIIKLLPLDVLLASGPSSAITLVLSLLLGAIVWNVGTWYLGLPASSSHTMIGSILGVGLAHALHTGRNLSTAVNWGKAQEIMLSLLLSPIFGFTVAALLLLLLRRLSSSTALFTPPVKGTPPPGKIRALLVLTCGGVSFAHGSNDGQKGVGLVMVILMGIIPAGFAVNLNASPAALTASREAATTLQLTLAQHASELTEATASGRARTADQQLESLRSALSGLANTSQLEPAQRPAVRRMILRADDQVDKLLSSHALRLSDAERSVVTRARHDLRALTDYAPLWVLIAIALALGVGTTVGWKRIVVTVGEKIGKSHLTYGQGAAAELVAASTIGVAALFGLPVSTTHVLSSGIAGTMVAQKSGLQRSTVRNIALAWALTLPMTMLLSGGIYLLLGALLH